MGALRHALTVFGAGLAACEVVHARASRRAPAADSGRPLAVVVLGHPSRRDGRPHPLQRWRVAIGVRTLARREDGILVLSGAAAPGPSEAEVMAAVALGLGVAPGRIRLEEQATTTWENVGRTIPLVEAYPQVAYASAPLHAARARAYLARQRPDLAGRLVRADDFRVLEHPALKVATALHTLLRRHRPPW